MGEDINAQRELKHPIYGSIHEHNKYKGEEWRYGPKNICTVTAQGGVQGAALGRVSTVASGQEYFPGREKNEMGLTSPVVLSKPTREDCPNIGELWRFCCVEFQISVWLKLGAPQNGSSYQY